MGRLVTKFDYLIGLPPSDRPILPPQDVCSLPPLYADLPGLRERSNIPAPVLRLLIASRSSEAFLNHIHAFTHESVDPKKSTVTTAVVIPLLGYV